MNREEGYQIVQEYVKNENLKRLSEEIKSLSKNFKHIEYNHIRREDNSSADFLVNRAIDEHIKQKKS